MWRQFERREGHAPTQICTEACGRIPGGEYLCYPFDACHRNPTEVGLRSIALACSPHSRFHAVHARAGGAFRECEGRRRWRIPCTPYVQSGLVVCAYLVVCVVV